MFLRGPPPTPSVVVRAALAANVESGSGSSFEDVVQTPEDRPRDQLPGDRTMAGHRSLQTERSMGSILVVVGHELGQQRSDMALAERQDVIQAFAA